ncbi:MAG: Hsp20/alpha crystallin family protein [Ferruginibacter sp.]
MTLVKVNNPATRSFDGLMKEFFNDFPATFGKTMREDVFRFPPVNITEKNEAYSIDMAVPGFDKADFQIKLDNQLLTISAEKKEEKNENTDKLIRREFSHKSFSRSFSLDEKIDADHISARYENGVLMLNLPKKAEAAKSAKEINVL